MKVSFATVICLGLLPLLLTPVLAHADQQYVIPLLGGRWAIYTITVKIPAEPVWAHDAVVDALGIWNQAQVWFESTYFPQAATKSYQFTVSNSGQVTVAFQEIYDPNDSFTGLTKLTEGSGNRYTAAKVKIVLVDSIGFNRVGSEVTSIAAHEFGHVLGLDHPKININLIYPN